MQRPQATPSPHCCQFMATLWVTPCGKANTGPAMHLSGAVCQLRMFNPADAQLRQPPFHNVQDFRSAFAEKPQLSWTAAPVAFATVGWKPHILVSVSVEGAQ